MPDLLKRLEEAEGPGGLPTCPACGATGYHEWNCPLNKGVNGWRRKPPPNLPELLKALKEKQG